MNALEVPESMKAVFWFDGDNSQLAVATSVEGIQMFNDLGVIACKHNAAGTGKEQAADLGNCFSLAKFKNKCTTVQHIHTSNHLLKKALTDQLKTLSKANKFHHQKHAHIVDHFSKQPIVLALSTLSDNITSGWIANGIIDTKNRKYPVMKKIIATCKKIPTLDDKPHERIINLTVIVPLVSASHTWFRFGHHAHLPNLTISAILLSRTR